MGKRFAKLLVAVVVATSLGACGAAASPDSEGSTVSARLLVFEAQAHIEGDVEHAAIRNARQARAFVHEVAAADSAVGPRVATALERGPLESEVVLAFVDHMGCDVAGSAELWRDGDDFTVRYLSVTPHEECDVANTAVVAFAVPRAQLPKRFTLDGGKP